MKHVLSAFLSAFSAVLRNVPQTVFRVRSAAVLAILVAAGASPAAQAQTSEWTWMGGSSVVTKQDNGEYGQPGVYGTQGQPSAANIPGGRLGAVSWTDKDGNFWLFGGGGLDSAKNFGFLNDLWEFDPSTEEWTWFSGSNTIATFNGGRPGVYGQQGTPTATNTPGGRSGALGWTDANGNLWLFGGTGFDAAGTNGNLNDLWEFNPSTREWTWVGGSSKLDANGTVAGVYRTMGSLTAGSFPGSRNSGAAWTSKDGSLWLFGGYGGSIPFQFGPLNDLWRYVPSTNQWAWMGGSSTTLQPGVYGQLGTPAPGNVPGARDSAAAWVDKDGNFWLFGGSGFVMVGSTDVEGYLNDLWKFDPSTNEWAWMSGSDTLPNSCADLSGNCNWPGVYGTLGTAATGNTPGTRAPAVTWTGQDGTLWLFGGVGSDANNVSGTLNDFWKFDPATNEWTWMGGSSKLGASASIAGVYGTLGSASAGSLPGSRAEGFGFTDTYGNFWLFGGDGSDAQGVIGYLNDLWAHLPVTATPTFSPASGTYATAQTVTISDATSGALIYYTTDGTTPTTASARYTGLITVSSTETIHGVAEAGGYINGAAASATYTIQPPPTFALAGSPTSLTVASGSQGTVTLTVTPQNGFNSTVSFACTGLQPGVSCTFSPATVTPSGTGAVTTQLTLSASTETAALRWNSRPLFPAAPLALAVGFLWLGKRRRVWMVLLLAMAFAGAGMLTACGSGSSSQQPAPHVPVTSTVMVNASSGSIQQSVTVTVTVN